ncbi:protein of unknown function [Bradyrhizobium sp. ORS 285]|nr:hypothetical protein BRAO285_2320032 [Bradyrhizobium sp. ORS 285]SMX59095.1 protein of unknown function [Bradyrhizobium sp. ORS 285]
MFPRIPPHIGGALRAIVTTREAGSGGLSARSVPLGAWTNEPGRTMKSQRPGAPMLASSRRWMPSGHRADDGG